MIPMFKVTLNLHFLYVRFTGTILGVSDADPAAWPDSKWRSLKVLLLPLLHFPSEVHLFFFANRSTLVLWRVILIISSYPGKLG
jgi:hypothetical protein